MRSHVRHGRPAGERQRGQPDRPRHAQADGEREEQAEAAAHSGQPLEQATIDQRQRALPARDRRHHVVRAEMREPRHGHDLVTACAQALDDPRQRADRRLAIAARIVEQHDLRGARRAARRDLVDGAADDLVRVGQAPVERVDMQADRDIAQLRRRLDRGDFGRRIGIGVAQIGRAEQAQRAAGIGLDQPLRGEQLQPHRRDRQAGQVGMGGAVIAQLMPLRDDAAEQVRLAQRIGAGDEEGGGRVQAAQAVEDARRPARIGPVVEGQGDQAPLGTDMADDGGARQAGPGGGADQPVIILDQGARAVAGGMVEAQDLAQPARFDRDRRWHGGGGERGRTGQRGPEAGILAAQPPQREAGCAGAGDGLHLVGGAGGVEHPDMVVDALGAVSEAAVTAGLVELRSNAGGARARPGLGHGQDFGGGRARIRAGPVIGVITQRHDRLARPRRAHRRRDGLGEPGLRGDRARRAARPVLVIRHDEQPVGDLGIGGQVPGRVGDRDGQRHQPALRGETAARLAEEGPIVGLCRFGQILQIEHHAASVFGVDHPLDRVEQRRTGGGIGEQRGGAPPVPLARFHRILHHRQHAEPVAGTGQHIVQMRVGFIGEAVVRPGDVGEPRHHPVERTDMRVERSARGGVPAHVEADDFRRARRSGGGPGGQPGGLCGRLGDGGGQPDRCAAISGEAERRERRGAGQRQGQRDREDQCQRRPQHCDSYRPATAVAAGIVENLPSVRHLIKSPGLNRGGASRSGTKIWLPYRIPYRGRGGCWGRCELA